MSREQVTIGAVVDVGGSVRSLKDLKGIIDDAKIALEGLDSDSKEYKVTLERLATAQGEYNKVLEATKDSQKNMSSTIEGITNVTNGMMGGFQALNGVLALTGTENKNLVETLVKLKAVSSVVQGFKQFTDAIKAGNIAFRIFNITVKSNPLMLLATSIITVIALVKNFTSSLGEANEEIRDLDKDIQIRIDKNTDFFNNKMKQFEAETKREKELAKARGVSEEELLEYDRKIYENRKKMYDEAVKLYEISEAIELRLKYPDKNYNELERIERSYNSILRVYKDAMKKINEAKDSGVSSEIIESLEDQEEYITNLFLNLPKKVKDPVNDLEKEVMESFGRMGLSGKATYKDVLLKAVVVANNEIFSIVDESNHKAIDSLNNMSETASELFVETLKNSKKIKDINEKAAINEAEFKHKEAVITTEIETKKREEANKTYLDNKKRREAELEANKKNAADLFDEFQNIQSEGVRAIKEIDKDISMSLANNSNEYINILKERITELDIDNKSILQKISDNTSESGIKNDPKEVIKILSQNIEMQNRYNNEILKQKALEAELKSITNDRLISEKDNLEVLSAIEKDKIDAREAARQAGLDYQDMDAQLEQFEQEQTINQAKAEMFLELANDEATSWEIRAEAIQSYDEYNQKSLQAFINAEKTKKKLSDRRKQIEKSAFNSTRSITYNTMDILNESIGNSKAGAIAKTTIDTYASATEAYRSQLPLGPKGPILGGLAAAAAITAGLKNVKSILSTKTPGNKGGGGSGSGGGIQQPDYLDNNPQITEQFVKMTSDDIDEINKSNRVYVVESDISNTQNKVRTTEGQATF